MTEAELNALLCAWLSQDKQRLRALELAQQCAQVYDIP